MISWNLWWINYYSSTCRLKIISVKSKAEKSDSCGIQCNGIKTDGYWAKEQSNIFQSTANGFCHKKNCEISVQSDKSSWARAERRAIEKVWIFHREQYKASIYYAMHRSDGRATYISKLCVWPWRNFIREKQNDREQAANQICIRSLNFEKIPRNVESMVRETADSKRVILSGLLHALFQARVTRE